MHQTVDPELPGILQDVLYSPLRIPGPEYAKNEGRFFLERRQMPAVLLVVPKAAKVVARTRLEERHGHAVPFEEAEDVRVKGQANQPVKAHPLHGDGALALAHALRQLADQGPIVIDNSGILHLDVWRHFEAVLGRYGTGDRLLELLDLVFQMMKLRLPALQRDQRLLIILDAWHRTLRELDCLPDLTGDVGHRLVIVRQPVAVNREDGHLEIMVR